MLAPRRHVGADLGGDGSCVYMGIRRIIEGRNGWTVRRCGRAWKPASAQSLSGRIGFCRHLLQNGLGTAFRHRPC